MQTNEFAERLGKILDTDEKKIMMIISMMGMSGVLAKYISETIRINSTPNIVKYAITSTAYHIMLFSSGVCESATIHDIGNELQFSEQDEESIYRKMKFVLNKLNEFVAEHEAGL